MEVCVIYFVWYDGRGIGSDSNFTGEHDHILQLERTARSFRSIEAVLSQLPDHAGA
jgi:hypothetical protein